MDSIIAQNQVEYVLGQSRVRCFLAMFDWNNSNPDDFTICDRVFFRYGGI